MKQYLLSIYQPDGDPPPPEVLHAVMRGVNAVIHDARAADAWVFNGGLHPASTATVVRASRGDVLITDAPSKPPPPTTPRWPERETPPSASFSGTAATC